MNLKVILEKLLRLIVLFKQLAYILTQIQTTDDYY